MNKKIVLLSLVVASLFAGSNVDVNFDGISVPRTDTLKREVIASKSASIDGKKYDINYHTILRSGQKAGDGIFGLIYDKFGKPVKQKDGSYSISNSNDFSSLLPVGNKLFIVSHFESRPAAIYVTELKQESDGNLKAISTKNVDFSSYNGLWVPCAGSVTPWNTHLGSEEYEPNAAKVKENGSINSYYDAMADYLDGDLKALNPYDYGWTTEIKVLNTKGDVKALKHFSMGRFAHELAFVMPDKKTVYLSDDGTNSSLFMFIADAPEDLTSGTLYAAKWIQTSADNGGAAKIKWVSLGHASDREVQKALTLKLKFSDIFDSLEPEDGRTPPKGFTSTNTTGGHEWLRVKKGMDLYASRLESRRYGAIKGATTEFRKMEGITYSPDRDELYIAISSVGKGMEDNKKKGKANTKYDIGGNNDIKLSYNPCGTVFKLNLSDNFGSKFVAKDMTALVSGHLKGGDKYNKCDVASLANPDNISFMTNTNNLLIGEDTGSGHQNDYIWSYNLDSDKLTRILTTPYGSETTSLYNYNNINGYGYIMAVVQHPYGEGDAVTKESNMPNMVKSPNDMRAYTGYIGPFPVINKR